MFKISSWKSLSKKNKKKININFKKIKSDSLICSFSPSLQNNFFDMIVKNNGRVLLAIKKNNIVGILVMERNNHETLKFLIRNKIKIAFHLLFSRYLSDKKILINYFFNFIFFKNINKTFNNNIVLVAVIPSERGKKIGEKLLNKLKKNVQKKIFVMTDEENYLSQKFYKKNNFKLEEKIYYGMRKLIVYKLL